MTESAQIPMVSAPMPWQGDIWSRLKEQLQAGQFPHALLLAGTQHTGKSRLALALARLLLCQEPDGGLNCGHCHACELSASGNHGDFRWLEPQEKSRVIKIDQVRAVVDFGNRTAGFGLRKVVVLTPADSMNTNAANALLKFLEEPAENTHLILVCHRLHGVPATIRSRCQILKLQPPDVQQSLDWLDQLTGDRNQSEQLLTVADRRPLLAEQLFREDAAKQLLALKLALVGLLDGRANAPQVVSLVGETDLEDVLAHLSVALQELLKSSDQQQLGAERSRRAFAVLDEITGLQRALNAGANPNRQLMLEAILGKLQRELGPGGHGDSIRENRGGEYER